MDDIENIAVAGAICGFTAIVAAVRIKRKCRRAVWVKPWIIQRPISGAYNKLFSDLLNSDQAAFRNFIRMDLSAFEDLLSYIESDVARAETRLHHPISPRERLCVTIRYLATGM